MISAISDGQTKDSVSAKDEEGVKKGIDRFHSCME